MKTSVGMVGSEHKSPTQKESSRLSPKQAKCAFSISPSPFPGWQAAEGWLGKTDLDLPLGIQRPETRAPTDKESSLITGNRRRWGSEQPDHHRGWHCLWDLLGILAPGFSVFLGVRFDYSFYIKLFFSQKLMLSRLSSSCASKGW